MKATDFACHHTNLGLTRQEVASLTGFTWRAFAALAHLRDAWSVADSWNARAIELCLKELLASGSMQEKRDMALKVLRHTLDGQEKYTQLITNLYPTPWGKKAQP